MHTNPGDTTAVPTQPRPGWTHPALLWALLPHKTHKPFHPSGTAEVRSPLTPHPPSSSWPVPCSLWTIPCWELHLHGQPWASGHPSVPWHLSQGGDVRGKVPIEKGGGVALKVTRRGSPGNKDQGRRDRNLTQGIRLPGSSTQAGLDVGAPRRTWALQGGRGRSEDPQQHTRSATGQAADSRVHTDQDPASGHSL